MRLQLSRRIAIGSYDTPLNRLVLLLPMRVKTRHQLSQLTWLISEAVFRCGGDPKPVHLPPLDSRLAVTWDKNRLLVAPLSRKSGHDPSLLHSQFLRTRPSSCEQER